MTSLFGEVIQPEEEDVCKVYLVWILAWTVEYIQCNYTPSI